MFTPNQDISSRGQRWAEKTKSNYEAQFEVINRKFGSLPLHHLNGKEVMQWIKNKHAAAPSMQFHASAAIRACVKAAIDAGKLKDDPFVGVRRIPQPNPAHEIKAWTEDELKKLVIAADKIDQRAKKVKLRLSLTVLLKTGIRADEFFKIRTDDLHSDSVFINGSKSKRSKRTLKVSPDVLQALSELLKTGKMPFAYAGLDQALQKACGLAEVPFYGLHGCRHTHASHLLRKGVSLPEVSARLGHADPGITAAVYSWAISTSDEKILSAITL